MPELPDLTVYREQLERRVKGQPLARVRLGSPFVLRTVEPPLAALEGRVLREVRLLGKRLVLCLEGDLFLLIHLMIAGRLGFKEPGARLPGKVGLAAFDFPAGTLILTEVSTKKRAALHAVKGEVGLRAFERGGLVLEGAHLDDFAERLRCENHTLKRSLTDPRLLSGIGNAYSDEILHRARLSPIKQTRTLTGEEIARLFEAARDVLATWTERLRAQTGDRWPDKVTAFRPEMAVHGRFKAPCPVCGAAVQRIAYADNETNYCPRCQNKGKLLADRSLSRLLKDDWPETLEDLEEYVASRGGAR